MNNFRTLFTRCITKKATDEEITILLEFIEKDDEVATSLSQYEIPEFTEYICKSTVLSEKVYAKKYSDLIPLYNGMEITKYVDSVFCLNAEKLIPLLEYNYLKKIIAVIEPRCNLIVKLKKDKDDLVSNLKRYTEKHLKKADSNAESSKKKTSNNENRIKKEIQELDSYIYLLANSWGNLTNTLVLLKKAEGNYTAVQSQKLDDLFANSIFEKKFSALIKPSEESVQKESILHIEIQELRNERRELRAYITSQEKKLSNLQASKTDSDKKLEEAIERIQRLDEDNKELKTNCSTYHHILLQLNGLIVNAICDPIRELEKIIFEIENSTESPSNIANWLKDHINNLRENFSGIILNSSRFDNLPAEYKIDIGSMDSYEDWAMRTPVPYNDELHSCKVTPGEFVLVRARGFISQDKLGQKKIIKADVVPYETTTTPISQESEIALDKEAIKANE